MKKYFYILSLILLSSCSMQRYCNVHYPCLASVRDSIITISRVVVKHDSLLVKVNGDTIREIYQIGCDSSLFFESQKGRAYQSVSLKNNVLTAVSVCKEDSFKMAIQQKDSIIYTLHDRIISQRPEVIKEIPVWAKSLLWLLGFLVVFEGIIIRMLISFRK